jgi:LacI family transcriptional regulator
MATMQEIALKAGVSRVTVSNVLNGKVRGFCAKTARQSALIHAIAQEMGYRPNAAARATASGRFGCVGLLLSTTGHRSTVSQSSLWAIEQALFDHDIHLTLARLPDGQLTSEKYVPKMLREWMCDGVIVSYNVAPPTEMAQLLSTHKIPSVWLNSKQKRDAVYPDDFDAGQEAARRMLAVGHRRILYFDERYEPSRVFGSLHYSRVDRFEGYAKVMRQAGLESTFLTNTRGAAMEEMIAELRQLLATPRRPTAVISYCDMELSMVREAATTVGLSIPRDVSTLTFRSEADSQSLFLRDTAMVVPEAAVGRSAAEWIIDKIRDTESPSASRKLAFTFQDKGSIAPPA